MRRIAAAAPLAVLALALAGCAGPESPQGTVLGAAPGVESPTPTATSTATPTATPTATATGATPSATQEGGTSPRGRLIKQVGEKAGSFNEVGGVQKTYFEFVVTNIEVDPVCTESYAKEPLNGHFVVLTVDATVMPDADEDIYFYDWSAYDDSGKKVNDVTGNGYSCLGSADELPFSISPGESVSGKIILDVTAPTGWVSFSIDYGSRSGWEWRY